MVKALRKLPPKLGVSVEWLETDEQSPAQELARLVLEDDSQPLADEAQRLARRVLDQRRRGTSGAR